LGGALVVVLRLDSPRVARVDFLSFPMIEEPYRWMEAIANRREYIEHQLSSGSPIAALSYRDGIVLFSLSRERQKIFEIYDRIAMGGIGHPGDIERLRMAAIEITSTEGFTRSAQDVSLRRLASYSLSPALKAAFEQIYGPPYLARLLFAELGRGRTPNLFLRLEYDGAMSTNGSMAGRALDDFGAISGTAASAAVMERFLRDSVKADAPFEDALRTAAGAWAVGHHALTEGTEPGTDAPLPAAAQISEHLSAQLAVAAIEAAVLERTAATPITWRPLPEAEIRPLLESR
jgi:proteasome alpha subunit